MFDWKGLASPNDAPQREVALPPQGSTLQFKRRAKSLYQTPYSTVKHPTAGTSGPKDMLGGPQIVQPRPDTTAWQWNQGTQPPVVNPGLIPGDSPTFGVTNNPPARSRTNNQGYNIPDNGLAAQTGDGRQFAEGWQLYNPNRPLMRMNQGGNGPGTGRRSPGDASGGGPANIGNAMQGFAQGGMAGLASTVLDPNKRIKRDFRRMQ